MAEGEFAGALPIITATTRIKAPIERVFDLSRSIGLYLPSTGDADEKIVVGKHEGLMEEGDEFRWEGSQFRFRQGLHIRVGSLEKPRSFTHEMVSGPFKRMVHRHRFEEDGQNTLMIEEFDYKSRGGPLGWFVENSYLTAHIRRFLADRNKVIKKVAQSEEWTQYLGEGAARPSDPSPVD